MDTLTASVQRAANMVKHVLSFSRGVEGERVPILLKHVIKETRALLEHSLPKEIEVKTSVAPDLWLVLGDATHMTQMLMNLSVNACNAMPQGGTLTIEARNQVIDAIYVRMHPEARPGRFVVVPVTDTGTGIPREHLDKIFEPFFTTKGPGKGTGLGLATVLGIVKGHGGFVNVYSEVGRGTKFSVYLPAAIEEPTADVCRKPAARLPEGAGEWILVVDDEAAIRGIARATLEAHGYRVLTAGDGAEAVALFAEHRDEIRAVLMDMMMPVMDGPATIRALRKMNARMPIIAVSGLVEKGRSVEISALGVEIFLRKPYTTEVLLEALHSALHGEPAKLAADGRTE